MEEKRESNAQSPASMNKKVIKVNVIPLKPGFEDVLLPELTQVIEASRQIAGCLAFDLYRLSEDRSTLILHQAWETHEAQQTFRRSLLEVELTDLLTAYLAQPMRSWELEEIF